MKNKQINYALVILATGLWVFISIKIIKHFFKSEEITVITNSQKSIQELTFQTKQNEILDLNYPDPFFENSLKIESKHKRTANRENKKPIQTNSKPKPNISYLGMLTRAEHNFAILKMNNRDLLIKNGSNIHSIQVRDVNADSVQLEIEGQKFIVHRKKP